MAHLLIVEDEPTDRVIPADRDHGATEDWRPMLDTPIVRLRAAHEAG